MLEWHKLAIEWGLQGESQKSILEKLREAGFKDRSGEAITVDAIQTLFTRQRRAGVPIPKEDLTISARAGGLALAKDKTHMSKIGKKGGKAVSKDRGHMSRIGSLSHLKTAKALTPSETLQEAPGASKTKNPT